MTAVDVLPFFWYFVRFYAVARATGRRRPQVAALRLAALELGTALVRAGAWPELPTGLGRSPKKLNRAVKRWLASNRGSPHHGLVLAALEALRGWLRGAGPNPIAGVEPQVVRDENVRLAVQQACEDAAVLVLAGALHK